MGAQNAEASEDRLVGTLIQDRFLVLERLAAGGMGVVYKAEQVPLGRPVALKILESKHNEEIDSHFSERFFLEAAAVAKLGHPNTIILYDYGRTDDNLYYYAMEYVDGTTLTRRVHAEGALEPSAAIHVALQICGSLREAHDAGMVHRDLKPSNVMLTTKGGDPYFVKVLDFGLVKVMGEDVGMELTKSGMLMGSPRYMAPEQVTSRRIDHRADIYAFGAVMYHALTGGPPFRQGSQYQVLRAQVEQPPPPFAEVAPKHRASPRLEALVMKCLAKEPDDRPQSMNDVAAELTECARELGIEDSSLSSSCLPLQGDEPSHLRRSRSIAREADDLDESSEELATSAEVPMAKKLREEVARDEAADEPAAERGGDRPRGGNRLLIGVGSAVALAFVAGLAAYLMPADEAGAGAPDAAASPPPEESTPPEEEPEQPAAQEPEQAAAGGDESTEPVRVVSEPAGARVRRGEADLGDAPVTLTIPPGETWELTLSLDGYEDRTVVASAGRGELRVGLDRRRRATGQRRADRDRATEETGETQEAQPSTSQAGSDTTTESTPPAPETDWDRTGRTDNRDPWAQ